MGCRLSSKKDYIKLIRGSVQGILLSLLLILVIKVLFPNTVYAPFEITQVVETEQDTGFIAISYLSVSQTGSEIAMSIRRLEEHLEVLYKNGYVTITIQDVIDYYTKDKKLPSKSLFLMFEDGYKGTAIFAQKIMEKYNFKATMLSYADKLESKDPKFLTQKDLRQLDKSTFWEMGTNGYRLSYINVFNKENQYLGELTALEYSEVMKELDRNYNQYLMDYIRDEKGIPKETYTQMKIRLTTDYELLESAYENGLGYVPGVHVLMHANTGSFGNNQKVSEINEKHIKNMFKVNFNREGYVLNNKQNDRYDLTRMQAQPYWQPNHLLMRIQDDTNMPVEFNQGDLKRMQDWETIKGAPEYRGDVIALTSQSKDTGLIQLKQSKNYQNYKISTQLTGNVVGSQAIYLRADESLQNYVKVQVKNNKLAIYECIAGKQSLLKEVELNLPDGLEDMRVQLYTTANRNMHISLQQQTLRVQVDNQMIEVECQLSIPGFIYLESEWGEDGYSQRNLVDDVYDGVFEKLYITNMDNQEILYDNRYSGFEKVIRIIGEVWTNVVNWFIETF